MSGERQLRLGGEPDAQDGRLVGAELVPFHAARPLERHARDADLAASPFGRARAALGCGRLLLREQGRVVAQGVVGLSVEGDLAAVEQHRAVAHSLDGGRGVRDEDGRPAFPLERHDPVHALALERLVADREDLVEQQDVGVEVHGEREPEAHVHPRRVRAHGQVDEALELGELDDVVERVADLRALHPVDRAAQEDVLPPREVGVEPGAELEQGSDRAADRDPPARGLEDAREQPEERRLARAVPADDAERLPGLDLERDVAERPDLRRPLVAAAHDRLLQRDVPRRVDEEPSADVLDRDRAGLHADERTESACQSRLRARPRAGRPGGRKPTPRARATRGRLRRSRARRPPPAPPRRRSDRGSPPRSGP